MLNFEKLILHNFGSYGHTEVSLRDRGFCLVTGQNDFDKDNAISNGSGKSFLWSAICFVLVGETINGLHSNLKNINILDDPQCYVTLYFSEHSDHYQITRYISPKSDLKITKNDIDVSGKGSRESEKKLLELLPDLTKNLITSTIIIGQGMPNKFSSFSPSGRKDLLEKLTRADFMIEDIKQRVNARLTELNTRSRELEDAKLAKSSQLTVFNNTLVQKRELLKQHQKPDFAKQQEELVATEQSLEESINVASKEHARLLAELTTQSDRLLSVSNAKADALNKSRAEYDEQAMIVMREQAELSVETTSLETQIKQYESIIDICPTCGQHIPGSVKPDTTHLREALAIKANKLNNLNAAYSTIKQAFDNKFNEISVSYDKQIGELQQTVSRLRAEATATQGSISAYEQSKNLTKMKLERLIYDQQTWEARHAELVEGVAELETQIAAFSETINILTSDIEVLADRLKLVKKMDTLIKRDFRGFLLANIINYIDAKAKDYCQIVFGTRELSIQLDGNDLNISYCGKMFDNLSGGEKQRVDLILQFAIRNMLTSYLNFSSNILVLDEITDFLDKKSCAAVLNLITSELHAVESVFIVSHHAAELALPIDSELHIRKSTDGISEIILGA